MFQIYEASRTKGFGRTSTNLYLQYKWDCMNYENHRYNVKTAKSRIDDKAPRTHPHLYYKPKKLQLEQERFCAIQRDNKHLMDRLATIQRKGGWIDDKNFHEIKSMNTWKRQQEMIELAYNNQAMLMRLLDCHSHYNHHKLEDEYLLSRKHKANIQKYTKDWRKVLYQMKCLRKRIREKVISARMGKPQKVKTDKEELKEIEKEAIEMEKAEKEAKRIKELKELESKEKSERLKAIQERKRAVEEWKKASAEWRKAREERLRLAEEKKADEKRKLAEVKERERERQKKKREKIKKELEEWREWKAENERIKKEKEEIEREETKRKAAEVRRKAKEREMEVAKDAGSSYEDSFESDSSFSESEISDESEKDVLSRAPSKTVVFFEDGQEVDVIETEIVEDFRADETELRAEREKAKKELKLKVDVAQPEDDFGVDNTKLVKTKFVFKSKDTVYEDTVSNREADLETETEDTKSDETSDKVGREQTKDKRYEYEEKVPPTKTVEDVDSALDILLDAQESAAEDAESENEK